ncbi:Taurine dioxygenase, alpha-ketoglutarate-dependent [Novosphingobium sp. CF614]|uniref:TauD/TfdA dioxygenase family protein n=1 Tax=Novosphingobium sp. CF614 TaxID=1884364 RepID=UPI0008EA8F54|nr:TauD/TfdA family dioxygenase [Novosphingobium sp. CF614]SFF96628.1 Taurine dioxygenase, alpha-ketoglutarate-dependent [Novosphingobium sp. CF614]
MPAITARDLSPAFGSEVSGLEPRVPLDDETIGTLRKLFDERGLLVFRDIQADIKFQTYLSELLIGNDVPDPDALPLNDKFMISNREPKGAAPYGRLLYHSDQMWSAKDRVDLISLYGKDVGQPATPTMFVSAVEAWKTLPENLRRQVQERSAIQHYDEDVYRKRAAGDPDVLVSTYQTGEDFVTTPIALTHPRTGKTILYVCQQTTQKIAGMPEAEGDALLEALFDHLYAPGVELAHDWREGDLIVWDNLALQHARPNVLVEGPARTLRKTLAPFPKSMIKGPKYASVAEA